MASRRRAKRKNCSKTIIFEVSDDDMSSEQSDGDCSEPERKILKAESNTFLFQLSENSNLESDSQILSPKDTVRQENSVEIIECIDTSNTSTIDNLPSTSDIIVVSEDNTNGLNDDYPKSRETSLNNVIDIVDENLCSEDITDGLNDNELCVKSTQSSSISVIDITEENLNILKEDDFNLEEGELANIQNESKDQLNSTKSKSCICITFSDEQMAEIYKLKFLKFIQSFVELEVENCDGLTINIQRDSCISSNDWMVVDEMMCTDDIAESKEETVIPLEAIPIATPKKKKKKSKKGKDLFVLDTNPSLNENTGHAIYSTKFQIDSEKGTTEEEPMKVSAQTCFNCDGNHAIKDCKQPRDFAKINAARQKFKSQKQTSRYHLEEDQKYSHIIPGQISDKLREALGVQNNQLPPFIYRMRLLGYPPGWLEEAKFVHSNLDMFDSQGNSVRDGTKKKQGLDPLKIVDYPGFNVHLEKNMKDEYRKYQVPPYTKKFSKSAMIEFYEKQFAKEQDDFTTCDMDLDNSYRDSSEKNVIVEDTLKETVVGKNPLISELKEVDSDLPSPSLTDLEKQKENLLAALDDSSNPKLTETTCEEPEKDDVGVSDDIVEPQNLKIAKVPVEKALEINVESGQDGNMSMLSPALNTSVNTVKTSMFGTPILKSNSPYARLPNPDNFMKDVSPVINFENLPNSTGKYEQMTGVLQKVRSTMKNLQNCDS